MGISHVREVARLTNFLASSNCLNQATSLHVLSSIPDSDHSPVCLSWVMDDQTSEENLPDNMHNLSKKLDLVNH
jgi:hypothetical protein